MSLSSLIIAASQWGAVDHMNPHLELATPTLLGARFMSDAELELIKEFWIKEYKGKAEISKGLWKRFPLGTSKYHDSYSTSHDEVITGIMVMSMLFDGGQSARDILKHGRHWSGLYFTGFSPPKKRHGKGIITRLGNWLMDYVDSEWLIFWNPGHYAFAKLAAGYRLNFINRFAIKTSIRLSLKNNRNLHLANVRLAMLEYQGQMLKFVDESRRKLGTRYRGYYRGNSLYKKLFEIMDS